MSEERHEKDATPPELDDPAMPEPEPAGDAPSEPEPNKNVKEEKTATVAQLSLF